MLRPVAPWYESHSFCRQVRPSMLIGTLTSLGGPSRQCPDPGQHTGAAHGGLGSWRCVSGRSQHFGEQVWRLE